jgi:hypothetical protein
LPLSQLKPKRKQDDVEIVGEEEENDAFAMYYADVNKHGDREPVYHPDLGMRFVFYLFVFVINVFPYLYQAFTKGLIFIFTLF